MEIGLGGRERKGEERRGEERAASERRKDSNGGVTEKVGWRVKRDNLCEVK